MATLGMVGYGATLKIAAAAVTEVRDMSGPSIGTASIDFTSQDATTGLREKKAGMVDPGEIAFDLVFTKVNYPQLFAQLRTTSTWTLTLSDGSKWVFSGYLKRLGGAIPYEDAVTAEAVVKISGDPVFTPAA